MKPRLLLLFLIVIFLFPCAVRAQVFDVFTNPTGAAWLTGSSWSTAAAPSSGQIADFGAKPTSGTTGVGIDMGGTTNFGAGTQICGAIYDSVSRAANLIIGNSSTTTSGNLCLNGATISSTSNVVLANLSTAATTLTVTNKQGSGTRLMGLKFFNGSKTILAGPSSALTAITNTINVTSNITDTGTLLFLGGGTYSFGGTSYIGGSGSPGGLLKLGAADTLSGGITVGNSSFPYSSGILELDSNAAVNNLAGNNITINPNSMLYLGGTTGSTFNATNFTLYLNGNGDSVTSTYLGGALTNKSGSTYTWNGNVVLSSSASIKTLGTATISITGNITGVGPLIKDGNATGANLVLTGTSNSWTNGTTVRGGNLVIASGSSISSGPLTFAPLPYSATVSTVTINTASQTIDTLQSVFSAGANATNSISIGSGDTLKLNQPGNTTYGFGAGTQNSTFTGSGVFVLNGAGILTLSSTGSSGFTGTTVINSGELRFNAPSTTSITYNSSVILNGGRLTTTSTPSTGGLTSSGTLALLNNSTIDLGNSTTHTLSFAASSGVSWTSGKILTITNWVPTGTNAFGLGTATGSKGKIKVGTTSAGLTAGQLAQINFIDPSTGYTYLGAQLSTGEIVPAIPTITTLDSAYGPYNNGSDHTMSVSFTTTGPHTSLYKVQLSTNTGTFTNDTVTNILGSGYSSPILVTLPAGTTLGTGYKIRVINALPQTVYGSANATAFTVNSAPPPAISLVSPSSAKPGDVVTITGSNFDATSGNNIVYFGGTRAQVLSGNTTSLSVTVPNGALFAPITVLDSVVHISGSEDSSFIPFYNNSYFIQDTFVFKPFLNLAVGTTPKIAAIGDLDGDGYNDLVAVNSGAGTVTVYRNNGSGGFISSSSFTLATTVTLASSPQNVKLADIDCDGKLDIVATSAGSARVYVARNTSTTGSISFSSAVLFSTGTSSQPYLTCIADFDGDGKPDIVASCAGTTNIVVLRNISSVGVINTSSFAAYSSFATNFVPIGLVVGDFDGDGKPDVAAACSVGNVISVMRNISTPGTISFSSKIDVPAATGPLDVAVADIDGDHKPDLIVSNQTNATVSVMRNNSAGAGSIAFIPKVDFIIASGSVDAIGLAVADFDGDGKPDVACTDANNSNICILRNIATADTITAASFASPEIFSAGGSTTLSEGLVAGDLNNDKYPDLVTANAGPGVATISILQNYPLPKLKSIYGMAAICAGGPNSTVTLYDSTGGGFWSSATPSLATVDATTGVVTGVAGGTAVIYYSVVSGGDTNTVAANVTVNSLPSVGAITGSSFVCPGSSITLSDTTASGIWGITNANATMDSGVVTGATTGADTATYTYTDVNSCVTTVTAALTIGSFPTAGTLSGADSVCQSDTATFHSTIAGGRWYSGNMAVATVDTVSGLITGVAGGSVSISYVVSNTCGFDTATRSVTVDPLPTVSSITGPSIMCISSSATLTDSVSGGTWSTSDMSKATIDATTGVVTAIASGTPTLSYTKTNSCGTTYSTLTINIVGVPTAGITSVGAVCTGDSTNIVFSGTTGAALHYKIDGGATQSSVISGGTFTLSTGNISTSHTYELLDITAGTCVTTYDTTVTVTPVAMQWVGATDTNWNNAANWSCNAVPISTDDVTIPSGTTYSPALPASGTATTGNLTIASGVTLKLYSSGTLYVKGTLSNNGTVAGAGTLSMDGSSAQDIQGAGRVDNLDINNASGVTVDVAALATIGSSLSISGGTLTTNDSLVLASDVTGTARVAPITAGGASISGNVQVRQYIGGGHRAYRFWSHPFTSSIPLSQIQQYIDITGTGGAVNGFTTTATNAPSCWRYDPLTGNSAMPYDPGWKPFTSTTTAADSNQVHQYQGIRLFIRGAKGQGLNGWPYIPSATTIGMKGALNQGTQTVYLRKGLGANEDYNQVGNPFASPVDIGTIAYNASLAGQVTGAAIFLWNPYLATAGAWVPVSISGSPYVMQAYTSFQIRAMNDSSTLTFNETDKASAASASLLRSEPAFTTLHIYDADYTLWDMLYLGFNDNATDGDDNAYDAVKPSGNSSMNFYAWSSDNKKMAIDGLPYKDGKIIPLGITSNYDQDFILKVENLNVPQGGEVYLHDKLLGQFTKLSNGLEYHFSITTDKATQGDDRFELRLGRTEATSVPQTLQVNMVPNPATDFVTISFAAPQAADGSVNITDITGSSVYSQSLGSAKEGSAVLTIGNLAPGAYLVEIVHGSDKVVKRLIKN